MRATYWLLTKNAITDRHLPSLKLNDDSMIYGHLPVLMGQTKHRSFHNGDDNILTQRLPSNPRNGVCIYQNMLKFTVNKILFKPKHSCTLDTDVTASNGQVLNLSSTMNYLITFAITLSFWFTSRAT